MLIHKKCGEDPDHPNYPKCKPVSNENQLFTVHLERLCREGNFQFFSENRQFSEKWTNNKIFDSPKVDDFPKYMFDLKNLEFRQKKMF